MSVHVYKNTATKAKGGKVYAFGRSDALRGQPVEKGGYALFEVASNYDSRARDGIGKSLRIAKQDMTYREAVAAMNRRCGYKAFTLEADR